VVSTEVFIEGPVLKSTVLLYGLFVAIDVNVMARVSQEADPD